MVTFPGSAYPKEISQQCTPTTHTEAVHCQGVLLGVCHPCLWPLKVPGSTLGESRQTSSQPTDAIPQPVPGCQTILCFAEARNDGGSDDNWKICANCLLTAAVKSSSLAYQRMFNNDLWAITGTEPRLVGC